MNEVCQDNRFEIIEKAKMDLLKSTNITTDKKEMEVLDNFLFRCWQMGWLKKYEQPQENCSCIEQYQKGYQDGLNANKWIPCSERCPKNNTDVIACFSCGTVTELRHLGNGIFRGIYEYGAKVVIAWQPLPEPYREGDTPFT